MHGTGPDAPAVRIRHLRQAERPRLYTKLIDDKVDFVVSGYGTNMTPAMPVVIAHNRLFLSLFGLR
jgi:hypothetical protein